METSNEGDYEMDDQNYIVLRREKVVAPPLEFLGTSFDATVETTPESLEIDEFELTRAERADLRRDPRTRAIAPPMPMKLIDPIDTQSVTPSASMDITWGVKAVGADTSPFDGSGVTIAVLDTGINPNHTAFSGVEIIQRNFTTESSDNDTHGHGTHCAGTIFGRDVNGLRIGVAPGVNKAIIGKVLGKGGGTSATLAKAIQWAIGENEANIVSMSLGIDFESTSPF